MVKRQKILVDRRFQHRLAREMMVIVVLVPIFLWVMFYLAGQYALSNPELATERGDWGLIGALLRRQLLPTLLIAAASLGLVYGFVIYYTHRIAGPVYRFCRTLDDMADGRIGQRIKLRRHDYFENLSQSLDRVEGALAGTLDELRTAAAALRERADTLGDAELRQRVAEIDRVLERYRPPAA
ncbi:MAG TPA: hypothetical protein VGA00_09585 [Acidiferrobacterales bacterium]